MPIFANPRSNTGYPRFPGRRDLFATVKALSVTDDADAPPVDGVSLAPLLTAGRPLADRPLYWHYPHYSNQGGRPGGAVRDGAWKLIELYETGRRELFDAVARHEGKQQPRQEAARAGRGTGRENWRLARKHLRADARTQP